MNRWMSLNAIAVIDALAVVPGDAMNKLKENLKVRRTTDTDDTPDGYEDIYTPVFTKIIDVVQEYLRHQFKNFQAEPL